MICSTCNKIQEAVACICKLELYLLLTPYSMEQSPSWEANWLNLQLIKKFTACYGTWKFITVLTSARHLSLSWANSIPLPTSWRSILILSSHLRLGLPNGLFPSGFPTKTSCTPLPSSIRATCPAHSNDKSIPCTVNITTWRCVVCKCVLSVFTTTSLDEGMW